MAGNAGSFKKGDPRAGRKAGVPNKATKATREAFQLLVDDNWDELTSALKEVRAEDPQAFIKLVLDFASFCVPRLKAIEHSGELKGGVTIRFEDAQ